MTLNQEVDDSEGDLGTSMKCFVTIRCLCSAQGTGRVTAMPRSSPYHTHLSRLGLLPRMLHAQVEANPGQVTLRADKYLTPAPTLT